MDNPGRSRHAEPFIRTIRRTAAPPPMATPLTDTSDGYQTGLAWWDNPDRVRREDMMTAPPSTGGSEADPVSAANGGQGADLDPILDKHPQSQYLAGQGTTQVPGETRVHGTGTEATRLPGSDSRPDVQQELNLAAEQRRITQQQQVGGGAKENPAYDRAQADISEKMQRRRMAHPLFNPSTLQSQAELRDLPKDHPHAQDLAEVGLYGIYDDRITPPYNTDTNQPMFQVKRVEPEIQDPDDPHYPDMDAPGYHMPNTGNGCETCWLKHDNRSGSEQTHRDDPGRYDHEFKPFPKVPNERFSSDLHGPLDMLPFEHDMGNQEDPYFNPMSHQIHHVDPRSPQYDTDYERGWQAAQQYKGDDGGQSPLEDMDDANVSHAAYDGYADFAVGYPRRKWHMRAVRRLGIPEDQSDDLPDQPNPMTDEQWEHPEKVAAVNPGLRRQAELRRTRPDEDGLRFFRDTDFPAPIAEDMRANPTAQPMFQIKSVEPDPDPDRFDEPYYHGAGEPCETCWFNAWGPIPRHLHPDSKHPFKPFSREPNERSSSVHVAATSIEHQGPSPLDYRPQGSNVGPFSDLALSQNDKVGPFSDLHKRAARGEAVDFDKYDEVGNPHPYHGWTLDFPEHVPEAERTYKNRHRAQGWYDDPENEPHMPGTRWQGTGDYADRQFHERTKEHSRHIDPNREGVIDSSGALGQYGVGEEDLNEYHPQGHSLRPINQTGYPEDWEDGHGGRGVYSTNPDLVPWEDVQRAQDRSLADALSPPGRRYHMPSDDYEEPDENGRYVDHEDDYGSGAYHEPEEQDNWGEQGSHHEQRHLINAGFAYQPHEYNGDRYVREDHNGHEHVVRAPNPAYGGMDTWHYEFNPSNEGDRDPYVRYDALRDGPRSHSFHAGDAEEAYNIHQNIGNDLSELASRGWANHEINLGLSGTSGNARADNRALGFSTHSIEARRPSANGDGYDRIVKTPGGVWAAHHVPTPNEINRLPHVSTIAEGRSRRDVLDAADRADAQEYLEDRGGPSQRDEETGHQTWQIPHRNMGSDQFDVTVPGEAANNPLWTVTHKRNGRIQTHTAHPTWASARDELRGRI